MPSLAIIAVAIAAPVGGFGEKRMAWAITLTGFIVGIPPFYGVGFVLMVPIIFAVIERYRLPPLVLAGPVFARAVARIPVRSLAGMEAKPMPESQLPGAAISIVTALLPAVLLVLSAVGGTFAPEASRAAAAMRLVSDPDVVMLAALAFATVTRGRPEPHGARDRVRQPRAFPRQRRGLLAVQGVVQL